MRRHGSSRRLALPTPSSRPAAFAGWKRRLIEAWDDGVELGGLVERFGKSAGAIYQILRRSGAYRPRSEGARETA
jgi:hypothetical protein